MNEEREGLSKKEMNNKKEDAKEKKNNREARRKRTWRCIHTRWECYSLISLVHEVVLKNTVGWNH